MVYFFNEVIAVTTGQLIKEARKKAGMTQLELAKKLNIPFQSVSQWERDIRKPKYETLERISSALGVPVSFLLGWDSTKERLENLGLSVEDIAYELDVSPDVIQSIIESNDNGSAEITLKIMKAASILSDKIETQAKDIIARVRSKLNALSPSDPVECVTRAMSQMTPEGQKKVVEYAEDILFRYRAKSATGHDDMASTPGGSKTPQKSE